MQDLRQHHAHEPEPGVRRVPLKDVKELSTPSRYEGFSRSGKVREDHLQPGTPLCVASMGHVPLAKIQEENGNGDASHAAIKRVRNGAFFKMQTKTNVPDVPSEEHGYDGLRDRIFNPVGHRDS